MVIRPDRSVVGRWRDLVEDNERTPSVPMLLKAIEDTTATMTAISPPMLLVTICSRCRLQRCSPMHRRTSICYTRWLILWRVRASGLGDAQEGTVWRPMSSGGSSGVD